ncbi:MAG TPA: PQQ-binding-like beta-propeller repeat protein [Planctomycetota bacterium]|nr:PQQ-binding-like beta-propeller repeat protein [Planctomycetota bacterium]
MGRGTRERLVLACALNVALAVAGAREQDAQGLLDAAGVHGGLCLASGVQDISFAASLARSSALYVQVLQPDEKLAAEWGAQVAAGDLRERLGIRNARLQPTDYASNLLNLIILDGADAGLAAGDGLKEVERILAPGGVLATRGADGKWTLWRKPKDPLPIAPCDSLRWRAGSRWQRIMYHDFASIASGDGKLLYRETVATPRGGQRFELVCRDAWNGRTLWKIEEAPFTDDDWKGYLRSRMGAAITSDGKVYTGQGKNFVCLDGRTGKVLSTLTEDGRPGTVLIHKDRYLLAGGRILDIESGRQLGKYTAHHIAVAGDVLYGCDVSARTFTACRIPGGEAIWTVNAKDQHPGGQLLNLFCTEKALHVVRFYPASITSMDMKTGETLWTYPTPPAKGRTHFYPFGDRVYMVYDDAAIKEPHDFVLRAFDAATGRIVQEGRYAEGKHWAGGCWPPRQAGDYLLYHHNVWLDLKSGERTAALLFRPKCDMGPLPANGMIYGFPGRKGGAIKGLAALAPRDLEFNHEPGGSVLKTYGVAAGPHEPAGPGDWPMFRASPARGNSGRTSCGSTLAPKWETAVGLGGHTYGAMDSQRTGLTQPVSAWGLVVVADIEGQRVVALDAETGKTAWAFHVGSRVDFSPALHDGLCLFGAKDGWVYCLDVRTGKPIYKLLIAPAERYIGGQEKSESMWPTAGDVLVADGVAYASAGLATSIHGGIQVVAFKPRTGEVVWRVCHHGPPARNEVESQPDIFVYNKARNAIQMGRIAFDAATGQAVAAHRDRGMLHVPLDSMDDWLSTNNRNRLSEDMGPVTLNAGTGGIKGRLIAFSDTFEVGFNVGKLSKTVFYVDKITLSGASTDGQVKWTMPPTDMNVDDIVLTPGTVYCAGHYESGERPPELRAIAPQDGKVLATHEIKGLPVYNGMSVAQSKLFVATREGKLLCFEGKQP